MRDYNVTMPRWVLFAALGAAFLTSPAWGQRHGGGSFGGHGGFVSHGSVGGGFHGGAIGVRASGLAGTRVGGWSGGFHGRPFGFVHPRCYGCFRPYYYPRYYGWYGYPGWGWYDGAGWYGDSYYSQPDNTPYDYGSNYPAPNDQADQQAEIDRLNDEVARLREEREAQASSSSNVRTRTGEELTQLVFLDKHAEDVRNYAIVGQTVWVFNDERARKIPLSTLDVPATKKANEARGLDFSLPN